MIGNKFNTYLSKVMNHKVKILLFTFLIFYSASAQEKIKIPDRIKLFFSEMIDSSYDNNQSQNDLSIFVDEESLKLSRRLDINYEGVKNKFLLSYEIAPKIINEIRENKLKYELISERLSNDFVKIEFNISSLNYSKSYYFKNNELISPVSYFTKDWEIFLSKYFRVKVSNPPLFNEYSLRKLDDFVDINDKITPNR